MSDHWFETGEDFAASGRDIRELMRDSDLSKSEKERALRGYLKQLDED